MRILHVPHAYAPVRGGAEHYCQRLSETLAGAGHEVRVVTANLASAEGFYQFGVPAVGPVREVIGGVKVERLPFRDASYILGSWLPPGARGRLLRRLYRRLSARIGAAIAQFRPDVVMAMPHLFVNVRCVLEAHRARSFPLVLVPLLHEEDPYWPTAEVAAALAEANAVVATTPYEADRLTAAYSVPRPRVFLCPGGVDVPASAPAGRRARRVLFLGRKVLPKGIDLLLRAMRRVWGQDPEVELVLAGTRVPGTEAVDALIGELPADERQRVRSLDDVTTATKESLLAEAACLVLPSKIESFGIVLLEAWAHGTPVVALDTPPIRSVVSSGSDGILVPPDDPNALAAALLTLLHEPERARAMGRTGQRRTAAEFTWGRVAAGFEEAYKHAISSHAGGAS